MWAGDYGDDTDMLIALLDNEDEAAREESKPNPPNLKNLRLDPELKDLCRKCGLKVSGRKQDLLQRLTNAFMNDLPGARAAICNASGHVPSSRERPRWQTHTAAAATPTTALPSVPLDAGVASSSGTGGGGDAAASRGIHSTASGRESMHCFCASPSLLLPAGILRCSECSVGLHAHCLGLSPLSAMHITCPTCLASNLNPFSPVVRTAAHPAKLHYLPGTSSHNAGAHAAPSSHTLEFDLPPALYHATLSHGRRFELRCFLASDVVTERGEKSGRQRSSHRWPLQTRLFFNSRETPVGQQPQAWDGHHLKDRHEDTPLVLQGVRPGRNRIIMTACDTQSHVAAIVVTEPRSVSQLIEEVRTKHTMDAAAALSHVKATFGPPADDDDDDDVVAGAVRIGLLCPLSMRRLAVPARGASCRHLECFDLSAFLECAKATAFPRWVCPICSAAAQPVELRVDPWTASALESLPAESSSEVEVQPDGSFAAVPPAAASSAAGGSGRKRRRSLGTVGPGTGVASGAAHSQHQQAATVSIDGEEQTDGVGGSGSAGGGAGSEGDGAGSGSQQPPPLLPPLPLPPLPLPAELPPSVQPGQPSSPTHEFLNLEGSAAGGLLAGASSAATGQQLATSAAAGEAADAVDADPGDAEDLDAGDTEEHPICLDSDSD